MSDKRVCIRFEHDGDLTESEQSTFLDDVYTRLDGTGIGGYIVVQPGDNWIEWEGPDTEVDDKVNEHIGDSRVADYTVLENTDISSMNHTEWVGHCGGDCGKTIQL